MFSMRISGACRASQILKYRTDLSELITTKSLDAKIVSKQARKEGKSKKAKGKSKELSKLLPFAFYFITFGFLEAEPCAELELPRRSSRLKAERVGRGGVAVAACRADADFGALRGR